jgi:hypothetical protein
MASQASDVLTDQYDSMVTVQENLMTLEAFLGGNYAHF